MSNFIACETYDGTLVVRFIRPEVRNAISRGVLSELEKVLARVEQDPAFDRLVFTGRDKIFASGADLREIASLTAEDAADFARRGQTVMQRIANLQAVTVAAVNGHCYGGALDLILACDRRISTPDSTFCHPGAGLGIITGWGGTQRLPRLIGEAKALEMFFTAAPISADEALRVGLIDAIGIDPVADSLTI